MTRRTFVGRLASGAAAAVTAHLLCAVAAAEPGRRVGPPTVHAAPIQAVAARAVVDRGPVPVRMADIVHAGRDFRTGLVDGVRLPAQGGDAWALTAERPGATYTTPPLPTEFPASHLGVHWRTDAGDRAGLRVEVRTSRDGRTWLPWRAVRPEAHGPDRVGDRAAGDAASGGETFGALLGARLARTVQVRVTFDRAGPASAAVQAITVTCLDSRRDPAGAAAVEPEGAVAPARPAGVAADGELAAPHGEPAVPHGEPAVAGPSGDLLRAGIAGFLDRVVPREAWGADESLRFKDGVNLWPTAFVAPSLLVVHHTAGDHEIVDAEAEVRAIYAYHAVTQGWGDVGYHLLIDSSGRVYEGRRGREPDADGRREIVSENVVAGHALDYNYGSVGIALVGNFQERQPGRPMLDALVDALTFMAQRAGIDVAGRIEYARSRSDGTALWRDGLEAVSGHRDCIPTECPGDNVYRLLPELRARVEEQLGSRAATPTIASVRPVDRNLWPTDLTLAWGGEPASRWYRTRLAGWRRVPGSDTIEPLSGYDADERPTWSDWTRATALSVPFPPDARGIYTLFVQGLDAGERPGRIIARRTFVVDRHVVVDDADAPRTDRDGAWQPARDILGYYGSGFLTADGAAPATRYRWQLAVPEGGVYAVQASWTEAENRTTAAMYRVRQRGIVVHSATVDQQLPGGRWAKLGEVALDPTVPCIVELEAMAEGVVVADAVRLVRAT